MTVQFPSDPIIWDDFAKYLRGFVTRSYFIKLCREGQAPVPYRLTPKNRLPVWSKTEIEKWLSDRGIQMIEHMYDGESEIRHGHC